MTDLGVNESHLYEMLLCLVYQRMIVDRQGEKRVIYEVMDKKEIDYYRKHKHNSDSFISVEAQIQKGIKDGIY